MIRSNIGEYRVLRREVQALKQCVTKHIELALGAAGAVALIAVAAYDQNHVVTAIYGVSALAMAVVVALLMRIVYYKMYSHNRCIGYCKLLSQEQYAGLPNDPVYLWEPSLARLRQVDGQPGPYRDLLKHARDATKAGTFVGLTAEQLEALGDEAKSRNWIQIAWWVLSQCILARRERTSWDYPMQITVVFTVVQAMFLFTWGWVLSTAWQSSPLWGVAQVVLAAVLIVGLADSYGQLFSLMEGEYTIERFCCTFMLIRFELLSATAAAQESPMKTFSYGIIR